MMDGENIIISSQDCGFLVDVICLDQPVLRNTLWGSLSRTFYQRVQILKQNKGGVIIRQTTAPMRSG